MVDYINNLETEISRNIDRIGNLRYQLASFNPAEIETALKELQEVYEGKTGISFLARYQAGEILMISRDTLDSQAKEWIKELARRETPSARVDLDFMKNYLPSKRSRIEARKALGQNPLTIWASENPFSTLAAGVAAASGLTYYLL